MTTATTNTVVAHTSDATFRTWVAEVIAQLLAVGITQTADTGQIDTTTVLRPAINTSGGYVILRFNDTAHATSPIFIKLEFGTSTTANFPQMWITVGTASNGSGTLTGTVLTRVAVCPAQAPSSIVTPYVSRFVYSATQGYLAMAWKIAGSGTVTASFGGFSISRSADSAGAVTTDAVMLISNSGSATGVTSATGFAQVISYLTATAYTTSPWPSNKWTFMPFSLTVTLYSTQAQVIPIFQYTPVVGISPNTGIALQSEISMGSTIVLALVGATTHTFIQVGSMYGGTQFTEDSLTSSTYGVLMLWE